MKQETNFYSLDLVRGLAALAVFIGHLRITFFKDTPINQLPLLGKIVFFFTGFGHESVVIFFVLSGFFIIKSINESRINKSWSFSNYGNNRLSRLWTVLIPALITGFILDRIGFINFPNSLTYSGQLRYAPPFIDNLHLTDFIGNSLFLQTILVPTFGSNSSLWTLACEFWYYAEFPLIYYVISRHYNTSTRIIFGIASVCIAILVGKNIILFFIIWLMGGISYILSKRKYQTYFTNNSVLLFLISAFLFSLLMIRLKQLPFVFNDYTLGFIFSILIPSLVRTNLPSNFLKRISNYLSSISYTLYLVHLPFVFLITSWLKLQSLDWGNYNFIIFLAIITLTLLYAALMWYLFERNTWIVKNRLSIIIQKLSIL